MARSVPILMYHHVSERTPAGFAKYTVRPASLRSQLRLLATLGFTTINLDALADAFAGRGPLPRRPVVVTFDDGYAEAVDHALEALESTRTRATFFVVGGVVGGSSEWLAAERGLRLPLAGWDRLRAVIDAGHAIGSHSMTHPHLTGLDDDAARRELVESRLAISSGLGSDVRHLAYPHGEWSPLVRRIAAESGYVTASTTNQAFSGPGSDPLALPRIIVDGRDRLPDVVSRLRTTMSVRTLIRSGPTELVKRIVRGPDRATG